MSPRLKKARKICNPPAVKGFKPYGQDIVNKSLKPVSLLYEEYEAIRLSDYDRLNHHQASVLMNVSRPTFTRIYASALRKVATAFVEGRQIAIEGGKVYFDSDWYHCSSCGCYFNNPEKENEILNCPLCGQSQIVRYDMDHHHAIESFEWDLCICPECSYEQKHKPGQPCSQLVCPKCNNFMRRKRR